MDETSNRDVTIGALGEASRDIIAALLDPVKIIPTKDNRPRYWKGLADLCGISGQYVPNIEQCPDPTKKVLDLWYSQEENSTITKLFDFLEELDRFDVIDDITELVDKDISFYKLKKFAPKPKKPNLSSDEIIITTDDVNRISEGLELQTYDAFLLFAEDDIDFATELLDTMEKQYGMKFCVKERDLVGGGFDHDMVLRLITTRCDRLIVILSPAFLVSSANQFFLKFAQSIGIENNQRKVIPCLYKECTPLPDCLKGYFLLNYTRSRQGQLWNFWDRLRDSIRTPDPDKLFRSFSENTQNVRKKQPWNIRPILQQENSVSEAVKPDHHIKFSSMVNLSSPESDIIVGDGLKGSTSTNSVDGTVGGKKKSWIKKLLPRNKNGEGVERKKKKKKALATAIAS